LVEGFKYKQVNTNKPNPLLIKIVGVAN